jgi:hypothetical protein
MIMLCASNFCEANHNKACKYVLQLNIIRYYQIDIFLLHHFFRGKQ